MKSDIQLFHSTELMVELFDELFYNEDPTLRLKHTIRADLLQQVQQAGSLTLELALKAREAMLEAARDSNVMLCTCSTLSGGINYIEPGYRPRIIRLDEVICEQAVMLSSDITIAVALPATISPMGKLIHKAAMRAGKSVKVQKHHIYHAWSHLVRKDWQGYCEAIADSLYSIKNKTDLIVLAQASMSKAEPLLRSRKIKYLSPAPIAVAEVLAHYRVAVGQKELTTN